MAVGVDIGGTHLRVGAVRGYEVLAYEKSVHGAAIWVPMRSWTSLPSM